MLLQVTHVDRRLARQVAQRGQPVHAASLSSRDPPRPARSPGHLGISFHQAPGAEKGEWKSTGGTGKFAGKEGSGWFQNVLMDGKNSVVKWGGDCR
jgi:hypothetical protein